jgi:hypothetical protein
VSSARSTGLQLAVLVFGWTCLSSVVVREWSGSAIITGSACVCVLAVSQQRRRQQRLAAGRRPPESAVAAFHACRHGRDGWRDCNEPHAMHYADLE